MEEDGEEITNLTCLLDRLSEASVEEDSVNLGAALDTVGTRSFGPWLLLAGLITLAPVVGDIPGVPTVMGILVLLVAVQLLFRRDHFWLPRWMLDRSVSRNKFCKALKWMQKPARWIDRLLRPRLPSFTGSGGVVVIALVCALIALAMPVMEVVPFSANGAGLALTAFGLALIARDGLLAAIAFVCTAITSGLIVYYLIL